MDQLCTELNLAGESLLPVQWLRAAFTKQKDTTGAITEPITLVTLDVEFESLSERVEGEAKYVSKRLYRDLPGRVNTAPTRESEIAEALQAVRTLSVADAAETRTREAVRAAKEAKTWEKERPYVRTKLGLLLQQTSESIFPKVYGEVIAAKKAEWRSIGEAHLEATARDLRTAFVPVFSKELSDMTFSGAWGTKALEEEYLENAVTLFAMVSPTSPAGRKKTGDSRVPRRKGWQNQFTSKTVFAQSPTNSLSRRKHKGISEAGTRVLVVVMTSAYGRRTDGRRCGAVRSSLNVNERGPCRRFTGDKGPLTKILELASYYKW
jgi:hypothetical protein